MSLVIPHPGEKRLIQIIEGNCKKLPKNMKKNIGKLLKTKFTKDNIIILLDKILYNLDELLKNEEIIPI